MSALMWICIVMFAFFMFYFIMKSSTERVKEHRMLDMTSAVIMFALIIVCYRVINGGF